MTKRNSLYYLQLLHQRQALNIMTTSDVPEACLKVLKDISMVNKENKVTGNAVKLLEAQFPIPGSEIDA